ncbi:MAG: OadG family protein [Desulfosarcinaceae bacterium]|nr:OadG family protein [Desulfosarcinaceae bacterium]
MYGLDAIDAHNGWAMAFAGACIVLTGLAVLSFIISQFPKFVGLFEKKAQPAPTPPPEPQAQPPADIQAPLEISRAADVYGPLILALGEEFKLEALHALFREQNLPHPHITIRNFWNAGLLQQTETGAFVWTANPS